MSDLTRRNVLKATGLTFCSAFIGGISAYESNAETAAPTSDSMAAPPPVTPGESRAVQVQWYKKNGATGSQALLATYGNLFGISPETAMKLTTGFSGGIGLTGEVCGMVSTAVMLLGLKNGPVNAVRSETYHNTVELAKQFTKDYQEQHKSVICRELINYDISTPEQYAKAHEVKGMWDICSKGLNTIVDLLENKYDILGNNNNKNTP